jgi:hypothetical protein
MASTSRYSTEMPGIYTPTPSHAHSGSSYFEHASRFSFATDTSGSQVVDPNGHETRQRYGQASSTITGGFAARSWTDDSVADFRFADTKSPPPLAHERYELAGGGMGRSDYSRRQTGDYDDYFGLQRQRGQWSVPPTPATGMRQLAMGGMETTPHGSKPWSLFGLMGGVAGRLFEFCTVPFRGFQAGGGQKYNMEANGEVAARLGLQDNPFLHQAAGPVQRTTPGDFPADNYGVLSIDSIENERIERPRAKRLRTADNWVVVGNDGEVDSRPSTPRLSERRLPDNAISPSQIPRPVSRAGAATPSLKRPSLIPVSRRSTMDRRSIHGSAKALSQSHTGPRSYSRLSHGSPAMFEEKAKKANSPLPKESQRLINKVRREEMEEDARMRRMSSQMSAMLREAKEALGSRVEVEGDYDDEAFGDDGGMQQSGYFPRFS